MLVLGVVMILSRRKETQRALSIMGLALGASVVLLPTYLIGVCGSDMMLCKNTMQPTLIFAGTLAGATSLVMLVLARKEESVPTLPGMGQAA